jgi:hypothetical protein
MVNPNTELHGSAIKIVKLLVLNVEDLEEKNDKRLLQIDMKNVWINVQNNHRQIPADI